MRINTADNAAQLEKVRHLEARFAAQWGGMGAVAEAFALAYAEAGDTDTAIAWYERAAQSNDGSASMKAQEQLGNLLAQRGWARARLAEVGSSALAQARADITAAVRQLQALAGLQPTLERLSLCGSAWKRLAMLEFKLGDDQAEAGALQMAIDSYSRALALAGDETSGCYPALNAMALALVLKLVQPQTAGGSAQTRALVHQRLVQQTQTQPDFRSHAGLVEMEVYDAVAAATLAPQRQQIQARYADLHDRVNALSAWGLVADTAALVLLPYARHADAAEAAAARGLLAGLEAYARGN